MIEIDLDALQLRLLISIVRDAAYKANADYEIAKRTPRFRSTTLEQRRLKMEWTQKLFNAMPEPGPLPGLTKSAA